mmetsp:Transcript_7310/g.13513  ORF Transcript_7310/g.13513 Transcript_7310/m.13513 type:complete len:340 (-) Transcript_7310:80-1099(-)
MDTANKELINPYQWRTYCVGLCISLGFGLYCSGLSAHHPATSIIMTGVGMLIVSVILGAVLGIRWLIYRNRAPEWQPVSTEPQEGAVASLPVTINRYSIGLSVLAGIFFALMLGATFAGFNHKHDEHANTFGMISGGVIPVVLLFFYWLGDPSSVFHLYGILTYIIGWTLSVCESGRTQSAMSFAFMGATMIAFYYLTVRLAHRYDQNFGWIFALIATFTAGLLDALYIIISAAQGDESAGEYYGLAIFGGILIGFAQILTFLAIRDTLIGNVGAAFGLSGAIVGLMCLAYPYDTPQFPKIVSTYLMNIAWGLICAGEVMFLGAVHWYRKYYPMAVEQY